MGRKRLNVQQKTITVHPNQWATVEAFAKDQGYSTASAALRRIIDEWIQFKTAQVSTPVES